MNIPHFCHNTMVHRAVSVTNVTVHTLTVWRDSNESRGFVSLLAHKHYIEHLSNSSYRFIKENYIAIIIVIEWSPSPIHIHSLTGHFISTQLGHCMHVVSFTVWYEIIQITARTGTFFMCIWRAHATSTLSFPRSFDSRLAWRRS